MRIFYLILALISIKTVTEATSIHDWLVQCYRGNETQPIFPNTIQLLIELIRKVEDANPGTADIRTVSAALLHQLRLDGIERVPGVPESQNVTPFGPNGMMKPKFQLILQMVSNVQSNLQIFRSLNRKELCQLHRMISTSVEPWRRRDEHIVCPMHQIKPNSVVGGTWPETHHHHTIRPVYGFNVSTVDVQQHFSRCPIEKGAIRTFDYGTFTPGTVIASIAAGLQPQHVPINQIVSHEFKKIEKKNFRTMRTRYGEHEFQTLLRSLKQLDNTYSASLAGDLAEICVYQGPYMGTNTTIGVTGYWNDTFLPRIRYLKHAHHFARWEMTDSEALGGIDGFFMAQKISRYAKSENRPKLSQILDMFYSKRGLQLVRVESSGLKTNLRKSKTFSSDGYHNPFDHIPLTDEIPSRDGITNACHRWKILQMINREKLQEETYHLAQVLQFSTSSMVVSDETLQRNCNATVNRFFRYAGGLIKQLKTCDEIDKQQSHPMVDVTVIIDESRNEFENDQVIGFLAEMTDVSKFGSFMSIIHGTEGALIVNRTQSIAEIFQNLHQYAGNYPTKLSLSLSIATQMEQLSQQIRNERYNRITTGLPQVTLIFTQGQLISEFDFAKAQRMMQQSAERFPDLYYIFVTQDARMAQDLMFDSKSWGEKRNIQYHVINEKSIKIEHFGEHVKHLLNQFPRRIMAAGCEGDYDVFSKDYAEEYVTPSEDLVYRINPYYLIGAEKIQIQFDGVSHGTFTVCMADNRNFDASECKTITDYETALFYIIPCERRDECPATFFRVSLEKSLVRCHEPACRYSDQVRFYIRQTGLRCGAHNGTNSLLNSIVLIFMSLISLKLIY